MDDFKISFDRAKIEKNIHWIIIAVATLIALFMVSPLSKSGVLVNIDHSSHYSRIACLLDSDMMPPANWCAGWQAGFPTSSYYYPAIDTITIMLAKIIGYAQAYKVIVALALFIPAIGAFMFLGSLGRKLAGAFAYVLVLFNPGSWHIGGFEEIMLVGMWPQVMSSGFFLIALSLFIQFYKKPSNKLLVLAALATILMTHPFTLVMSAMSFSLIVLAQWKESIKREKMIWLAKFIGLAFLVNAYYILPMLANMSYLMPKGMVQTIDMPDFVNYFWAKISLMIIIAGALGLAASIYALKKNRKDERLPLIVMSLAVIINFWLSFARALNGPWFIGIRMEVFLALITFMNAALFLDLISNVSFKNGKKIVKLGAIVGTILLLFAAYPMAQQSFTFSKSLIIIPEGELKALYGPLSTLPPGRILIEENLYNSGQSFLTFTHLHMLIPTFSGREIVGIPFFYPTHRRLITTEQGQLFGKLLPEYNETELRKTLEETNLRFIIAHTPMYINYFVNRSKGAAQMGPFTLIETNITPTYFQEYGGKALSEEYTGTYGKVTVQMQDAGKVAMKVNPFPNWKASVDGKAVAKIELCDGNMCVPVSAGSHTVEFKYGYSTLNYVSYLLSLAGLIIGIILYRRK